MAAPMQNRSHGHNLASSTIPSRVILNFPLLYFTEVLLLGYQGVKTKGPDCWSSTGPLLFEDRNGTAYLLRWNGFTVKHRGMRGYFRQFFYTASVPRPVSGIFPWISAQMSSVVQSAPRVSPRCWTYKTLYRPSSARLGSFSFMAVQPGSYRAC